MLPGTYFIHFFIQCQNHCTLFTHAVFLLDLVHKNVQRLIQFIVYLCKCTCFFLTRPGCDILVWAVLLMWGKSNHCCLRLFNLCFMFIFWQGWQCGRLWAFLCWKFLRLVCKLELCIACFYRVQLKQKCCFFLLFARVLCITFLCENTSGKNSSCK